MTTPGCDDSLPDWSDEPDEPTDAPLTTPSSGNAELPFPDSVVATFTDLGIVPFNRIITGVTAAYLDSLDPLDRPGPMTIEAQLLATTNTIIKMQNQELSTAAEKHKLIKELVPWQIAQILLRLHHVIRIAPNAEDTDREYDLLGMYQDSGRPRGTYTVSDDDIRTTARLYNSQLTLANFKEVHAVLQEDSPRTHQSTHRDLIAVGNGIVYYGTRPLDITVRGKAFHFDPKSVHAFDPMIVFLSKAHVDYVDDAEEQIITHPIDGSTWDIVSWIDELFDDEGLPELIWEIIGAIIRPHVSWGKTAWFYSEVGSNGKGTLCALMRNLIGPGAHTSIPLSDFGKNFALEPLVRANAIIVDENDVGTFIDKAANLKAIVTNDVIQIDRKYRTPIAYQFYGFMIQCLNEFPLVKDKSESFYRRQLFVPFTKSFTGAERKYIKDDYLQRPEVLEYALWYVINRAGAQTPGSYYELSQPTATNVILSEYKEANDPIRSFWEEFRDQFVWDLLPFTFLYDLYKVWFTRVSPSGSPVSRQRFVADLAAVVRSDTEFDCADKNKKIRPSTMLDAPEHLIAEYELKSWYSPSYSGSDLDRLCKPVLSPNYRGILRTTLPTLPTAATTDDTTESED